MTDHEFAVHREKVMKQMMEQLAAMLIASQDGAAASDGERNRVPPPSATPDVSFENDHGASSSAPYEDAPRMEPDDAAMAQRDDDVVMRESVPPRSPPGLSGVHDDQDQEGHERGRDNSANVEGNGIETGNRKRDESTRDDDAATEVLEPPPKFPRVDKQIRGWWSPANPV